MRRGSLAGRRRVRRRFRRRQRRGWRSSGSLRQRWRAVRRRPMTRKPTFGSLMGTSQLLRRILWRRRNTIRGRRVLYPAWSRLLRSVGGYHLDRRFRDYCQGLRWIAAGGRPSTPQEELRAHQHCRLYLPHHKQLDRHLKHSLPYHRLQQHMSLHHQRGQRRSHLFNLQSLPNVPFYQ